MGSPICIDTKPWHQAKKMADNAFMRFCDRFVIANPPASQPELGPCYEWIASDNGKGYGHFTYMGRNVYAHRFAWFLCNGEPGDAMVLHKCDNRKCVNPSHLFLGAARDNTLDMVSKGRHGLARRTHCKNGHEFTEDNIIRWPSSGAARVCKQCHRIQRDRVNAKAREKTKNGQSNSH